MDSSDAIQLLIILTLLGLSAFFSATETALTSVNKIHIPSLHGRGNKGATFLLKMIEDPTKLLCAVLIGNIFVNINTF